MLANVYDPLNSVLMSVSDNSTLKVCDWENGELEWRYQGHTRRVSACRFDSKEKDR